MSSSAMNGDHRPRMSVVMPNYNHGHLIEDALSAFARQTMPAFEVVVVDDGSTDDSVTRLQALAARWPWLKVHQLPANRGVNTACNTGLALVSGDFISCSRQRMIASATRWSIALPPPLPPSRSQESFSRIRRRWTPTAPAPMCSGSICRTSAATFPVTSSFA